MGSTNSAVERAALVSILHHFSSVPSGANVHIRLYTGPFFVIRFDMSLEFSKRLMLYEIDGAPAKTPASHPCSVHSFNALGETDHSCW